MLKTELSGDDLHPTAAGYAIMAPLAQAAHRQGARVLEHDGPTGWRHNSPMDNVCHTLVGAAMGEAGLKSSTRFGNPALMIAVEPAGPRRPGVCDRPPAVSFRRGWTHGVLAQALLPLVFVAACSSGIDGAGQLTPAVRAPGPGSSGDLLRRRPLARLPRLSEQLRRAAADAVLGPLVLRRHPVHRRRLDVAASGPGCVLQPPAESRPDPHGSPSLSRLPTSS